MEAFNGLLNDSLRGTSAIFASGSSLLWGTVLLGIAAVVTILAWSRWNETRRLIPARVPKWQRVERHRAAQAETPLELPGWTDARR